jgi:phosphonate transport system permease protein
VFDGPATSLSEAALRSIFARLRRAHRYATRPAWRSLSWCRMRAPSSGVLTGPVPQAPPQPSALGRNFGVTLALAILLGLAARVIELRPLELLRDIGNIGLFVKGYLHPSFTHIGVYAWQCVVTVCIALWGTPRRRHRRALGLCGARNLSPHPVVYFAARRVLDVLRAGQRVRVRPDVRHRGRARALRGDAGPGHHTGGVLGKLLSETIESIDPGQIEGVAAVGAGPLSVISFGVALQVMPNFLSYILLRFESDIRSASVIGMVAAAASVLSLGHDPLLQRS